MIEVAVYFMYLSAVSFAYLIVVEKLEILVSTVDKANVIFSFAELTDDFLLSFAVIPQKTEISANNKRIACFKCTKP